MKLERLMELAGVPFSETARSLSEAVKKSFDPAEVNNDIVKIMRQTYPKDLFNFIKDYTHIGIGGNGIFDSELGEDFREVVYDVASNYSKKDFLEDFKKECLLFKAEYDKAYAAYLEKTITPLKAFEVAYFSNDDKISGNKTRVLSLYRKINNVTFECGYANINVLPKDWLHDAENICRNPLKYFNEAVLEALVKSGNSVGFVYESYKFKFSKLEENNEVIQSFN
jgi:hypothetical protein